MPWKGFAGPLEVAGEKRYATSTGGRLGNLGNSRAVVNDVAGLRGGAGQEGEEE
jgi:hypothetical protein